MTRSRSLPIVTLGLLLCGIANAQFIDEFDASAPVAWTPITGDGEAQLQVVQQGGAAQLKIDASRDRYGVWWTCIKRDITSSLDLHKLALPAYELRVEAKVRGSHAPRRVNFMINTQRTTDYHEHLREYDLADASRWHTISMTTRSLDVVAGDTVFVQLCATDWGPERYQVDIDYYRADVVHTARVDPDRGEPLIYHPPLPDPATFTEHLRVAHDSSINPEFATVNFDDWRFDAAQRVLTLSANQWIVLRWDLHPWRGRKASGAGLLELTSHSVAAGGKYVEGLGKDLGEEFPRVRVIEILGGDPEWDQRTVTYASLTNGQRYADVFNTQMIVDLELTQAPGGKSYFSLSRPVMQRLLDGTTKGLLIRPLGALSASIYSSEGAAKDAPLLHFTLARE